LIFVVEGWVDLDQLIKTKEKTFMGEEKFKAHKKHSQR